MTEITRSIEIMAPKHHVWSHVHPKNWTRIFDFVKSVNGYSENGEAGVGTTADIVAGDAEAAISYHIEVTEFVKESRIGYRRYGGPLSGRGKIEVRSTGSGTIVQRTSYYDDDLSEETIKSLGSGIDKDNLKLKRCAEAGELVAE